MGKGLHKCVAGGVRVDDNRWPVWADPGHVVKFPGSDEHGRVRFVWRCCGAILVEELDDQFNPACATTTTRRWELHELRRPVHGLSYSVPCVGAAWSLNLPCGHLAGEGCDCDTIAVEAAAV
jgi:hypothetical protein